MVVAFTSAEKVFRICHLLHHVSAGCADGYSGNFHTQYLKDLKSRFPNIEFFQGGIYIFQLFDSCAASGLSLLWVCFFQTIAISWCFGIERFNDCVYRMMGRRLNCFFTICLQFCAPLIMMVKTPTH